MSDIRFIVNENMQIIAVFRPFFTAIRRVAVVSNKEDREVNLRVKLHVSYIDQLEMPAIFS